MMDKYEKDSDGYPVVRRIETRICDACLKGIGRMCHTPGCVLCRHVVDLPLMPELYEVLPDRTLEAAQEDAARLDWLDAYGVALVHDDAVGYRHRISPDGCTWRALIDGLRLMYPIDDARKGAADAGR